MLRRALPASPLLTPLLAMPLAACGGSAPVASPTVVAGTPTVALVSLTVTLTAQPQHTFIVHGGRWRVCDSGTVSNPSGLTAHDVRVVVTYLDQGVVVGRTTRQDATGNGGALGDIPPGGAHDFTVCGIASNEPDQDRVDAQPGGATPG